MRLTVTALLCAALAAGWCGVAFAGGAVAFDRAGFHIALPAGWAEAPALEKMSAEGFKKGDPDDPVQAFAWSNPRNTAFVLVQVTSTAAQVETGAFRSNLTALENAVPRSMGLSGGGNLSLTDDGTVMTGTVEGESGGVHVVMDNLAAVDTGRHVRAYSAMCMLREPVSRGDRRDCDSLLASFAITVDRSEFLPLEPK